MGGSIQYNPQKTSTGHLAKNVIVAMRLGYVERTSVGNEQYVYTDLREKSQYGSLYIKDVNEDSIDFEITLFTYNGNFLKKASYSLSRNAELDVNNDGLPDLSYSKSKQKRLGFEDSVYLNFISSQDTLQTNMFSVLKEQYQGENYPNGLIGINPNGRFIISEYTSQSSDSRSMVGGYVTGDYVLDSKTGEYKIVKQTNRAKGARTIAEDEVSTIIENEETGYRFTENDFLLYNEDDLLAIIPFSIKCDLPNEIVTLEKLNLILTNKQLIEETKQIQEIPIPSEIYSDVIAQIPLLSEEELIQLNRIFLEETYQDLCPKHEVKSIVYSEVLPLVDVDLGKVDRNENVQNLSRPAATNLTEYSDRNKAIKAEYEKYTELYSKDLSKDLFADDKTFDMNIENCFIGFGFDGHFNSSWGSLDHSGKGVLFIQVKSMINANCTLRYDEIKKELSQKRIPLVIGPINLDFTINASFQMPIEITVSSKVPMVVTTSVTGLYGVGYDVDLDYGFEFYKKWFLSIPYPYIDWNSNGWSYNDTAYYVETLNPLDTLQIDSAKISINPKANLTLGLSLWNIANADLTIGAGLLPILEVTHINRRLKGVATVKATLNGSAGVSVGIDNIPILKSKKYNKRWNLFDKDYTLAEWELLDTEL